MQLFLLFLMKSIFGICESENRYFDVFYGRCQICPQNTVSKGDYCECVDGAISEFGFSMNGC